MRIRQVRPEFFSDPVVGRLTTEARLIYIGLWCIADDAGWLEWDLPQIAAMLSPYQSVPVRERMTTRATDALVAAERIELFSCGCALIPRLADHQKIGGNKSFTVRDRHESRHSRTSTPVGRVGSNGSYVAPARAQGAARQEDDDETQLRAAYRKQGLPV
jgi:hypothetical protein